MLEAIAVEMVSKVLEVGDLLVVEGHANPEEIGRCAMATAEVVGFTFQNHLFRLRSRRLNPLFGLAYLNGPWTRAYWRRMCSTSSGLNTINRTKLARLEVSVPQQAEQEMITRRLAEAEVRVTIEESLLAKLKLLKKGLMEDLLTGRVRVNVEEEQS
jgi:type I restriction enzyme, S subunit